MRLGGAEDVELIRVRPPILVPIRRTDAQIDRRPSRNDGVTHLYVLGGLPQDGYQGCFPSQAFLDCRRDQIAVLAYGSQLVWMGEKQVEQIARRPIRSLEARRKQQTQERDDGVVVQLLPPISALTRSPMMSSV